MGVEVEMLILLVTIIKCDVKYQDQFTTILRIYFLWW